MANKIYSTTLNGLSTLVSRQVADAVLRRALRANGSKVESVDAAQMSRALRGGVRRALERSLPRAGVRRVLADLDERAAQLEREERSREATEGPAPDGSLASGPIELLGEEDVSADDEAGAVDPAAAGGAPLAKPFRRGADAPPPSILDRLGDQDAVRQWVWLPHGASAFGRGVGPEPSRVRHQLAPLLTVLDRAGAVRSLHVDHGRGHVLIGRTAGAALAVSGDPDMNLGAIYAAFRALEEEP